MTYQSDPQLNPTPLQTVEPTGPPVPPAATAGTGLVPGQTWQAVPPPSQPPDSAATRHLCAAAYLDEDFRREALSEVYYEPRRVVAPSYGFRLAPVLWHSIRARAATVWRDAAVTLIWLLSLCLLFFPFVVVVGTLLILQGAVSAARLIRDQARRFRTGKPVGTGTLVSRLVWIMVGLMAAGVLWTAFAAFAVAAAFGGGEGIAGTLVLGLLLASVMVALPVGMNLWSHHQVEKLAPGAYAGDPPQSVRYQLIEEQQRGNTSVYAGYRPFVGSGEVINSWGFPLRLIRAQTHATGGDGTREFDRAPFTADEILNVVGGQLHALTADPAPERRLPGLTVSDRVFQSGTEVADLFTTTEPAEMLHIIRNPTSPTRHYLQCQVVSWAGEIVTTVYVHFAVQGRTLYTEVTTTALAPCRDEYREMDYLEGVGPGAYWRAAVRGLASAPKSAASAPLNLARSLIDLVRSNSRAADTVRKGFDHGARLSLRELATADVTRNHIQTQDILKFKRIIERRLFAAVLDFLVERGVDVEEYRQRAQTVMNIGAVGALHTGSGNMQVGVGIAQNAAATPGS